MKKKLSLDFKIIHIILYILFIIGTIVSIIIVYKNVNSSFAIRFVIGYLIYLFLFFFYFIFIVISNIKKSNLSQVKKIIFKFFIIFILFWITNVLLTYLIKGQVNVLDKISVPIGTAFGIAFSEFLYTKQKN